MPDMVDPIHSLISFQQAYENKLISLSPCNLDKSMRVLLDNANDSPRITYAIIDGIRVKALAIYLPAEPIGNIHCFGLGYAVAEDFRLQGYGKRVIESSIEEMRHGFKIHLQQFYIEAIVGVDNAGSNKLASRFLSTSPKECNDIYSGVPARQYLRLIS